MSAKASGSDAQANGSAKSRDHTDGSEDRKYTPQQKAEVIRIRRCGPTSFYEILAIEKTASDGEIKKAYRKISLLTHPDKNGYDGADEAFKMVSRAFQILSDSDKKSRYDQFGGDPDNRFSNAGAGGGASPFSGFARSPGGRMPNFDDEISPEELFNRFFGGGGAFGGPFGGFGGPQFVFNMGGGPGFTVHRMGGQTPRRRPAQSGQAEPAPTGLAALTQLLPLILLFILPLISSFFTGSSDAGPSVRFDHAVPPQTMHRITNRYKIDYFVNPRDVDGWNSRQFNKLDHGAEIEYVSTKNAECRGEMNRRTRAIQDATGFFFTDMEELEKARKMKMPACRRLDELGLPRPQHY